MKNAPQIARRLLYSEESKENAHPSSKAQDVYEKIQSNLRSSKAQLLLRASEAELFEKILSRDLDLEAESSRLQQS
jgi:hypothetical protein